MKRTQIILGLTAIISTSYGAPKVVPGTGKIVNQDKFEDPSWMFKHLGNNNYGKPVYGSTNQRWTGNNKRVVPDKVITVNTPAGGLNSSHKSMLIQTLNITRPKSRPSSGIGQADLLMQEKGRSIQLSQVPNFTVRVFIPEWKNFEQRYGSSFGIRMYMRCKMTTYQEAPSYEGRFGRRTMKKVPVTKIDDYYPGFWIQYVNNKVSPFARFTVRADNNGRDYPQFRGNSLGSTPKKHRIAKTGWWTFGASMLPGGTVQYYAGPGVDPLTEDDFVMESKPYECHEFNKIFFDVVGNGSNWSTGWIIDDPTIYVAK